MSVSALDHVLLRRQAVLDAESELVGYSLALAEGSPPALPENTRVAALVCAAYAELGIRSALGQKLAYLHADPGFIHDDVIEALPPDGVVLELVLDPDLAPDAPPTRPRSNAAAPCANAITRWRWPTTAASTSAAGRCWPWSTSSRSTFAAATATRCNNSPAHSCTCRSSCKPSASTPRPIFPAAAPWKR